MEFKERSNEVTDSYEKAAISFFGKLGFNSFEEISKLQIFDFVEENDSKEVITELVSNIMRTENKNIDNIRVYPDKMIDLYKEAKEQGSDEFFDSKFTCSSGKKYLLGFNYVA